MLRIENLEKTYENGTEALRRVSFDVEAGEFVVILGTSGSGKSTLMRCINRLVEPTGGKIFFGEQEITRAGPGELRRLRRKIGMVFQQYNLVSRSSVLTNALTGSLGRLSSWAGLINYFPRDSVLRARGHLRDLGIDEKSVQRAGTLSGGQQQRVGIARALMQQPDIILADEPVSSLDPATSKSIMRILREINQTKGVTILCNLHIPELAREFGRRVLALKAGRVIYDGSPENLDQTLETSLYEPN
ncbi:MAG: phosphonate ABC transporter ATP-binding protein [Nitrospinaceae bacterium]|nr:MAG: phosphonate ABC transporter ATP-binding protein [Nitrospinaceae bacterium]